MAAGACLRRGCEASQRLRSMQQPDKALAVLYLGAFLGQKTLWQISTKTSLHLPSSRGLLLGSTQRHLAHTGSSPG